MIIQVLAVGQLKTHPINAMIQEYLKRFTWRVVIHEIAAHKQHNTAWEAAQLLALHPPTGLLVRLDERGKAYSSVGFSQQVSRWRQDYKTISFVIGGDDGFDDSLKSLSGPTLAFGPATWPHPLVRLMLVEQLYRAQQIAAHHPYHRAG